MKNSENEFSEKSKLFQERLRSISEKRLKELDEILTTELNNFDAYIERGNIFIRSKNYNKAIDDFNKALQLKSDDYRPFLHLGEIYLSQNHIESYKNLKKAFIINSENLKTFNHFLDLFHVSISDDKFVNHLDLDLQSVETQEINLLLRAAHSYIKKQYTEAIQLIDELMKINSNNFIAFLLRSRCFLNINDGEKASIDINKAIELNSEESQLYYTQGEVFSFLKNYEESIKSCHKTLEKNEYFWPAYVSLGNLYIKQNKLIDAVKSFSEAIGIAIPLGVNPQNLIKVYFLRGTITYDEYKYLQARTEEEYQSLLEICNLKLHDLSKVIDLDPTYPKAHLYRGRYFALMNEFEKAIYDFETELGLTPEDEGTLSELSSVYSKMNDFPKALEYIEKVITINSSNYKYYYDRGLIKYKLKQLEESATDFTTYINNSAEDQNLFLGYYYRANAYFFNKQYNEAKDDFTKTIELNPNDFQAYLNRGNCNRYSEDFDNAILDYSTAIRIKPDYINAFLTRSDLYINLEEYEKSISDLQTVTELDPYNLIPYYNIGVAYLKLKEYKKAERIFKKGIESSVRNPDPNYYRSKNYIKLYPELYYSLGVTYALTKNIKDSIKTMEITVNMIPEYLSRFIEDPKLTDIIKDKKFQKFIKKHQKSENVT